MRGIASVREGKEGQGRRGIASVREGEGKEEGNSLC